MLEKLPFLTRFFDKALHDLLPAALASMIGTVVLNYYTHTPVVPPPSAPALSANKEMMQIVRDEHSLIVEFLRKQSEAEKKGNQTALDEMSDSKALHQAGPIASSEPAAPRSKASVLPPRYETNSMKMSRALKPQRQLTTVVEREPLQLVLPKSVPLRMSSAEHPIPPALIPFPTSTSENSVAAKGFSSRFAGVERFLF